MVKEKYGLNSTCQYQLRGLKLRPNTMLEHIAQINNGEINALKPPMLLEYASGSHITMATW